MDERTMDNGPWHKLTGLQPVELKSWNNLRGYIAFNGNTKFFLYFHDS